MKTIAPILGVITISLSAFVAAAHPHEYVQPNPGAAFSIGLSDCTGDTVSFGAVCFTSDEVGVGTTLTIQDDRLGLIWGVYCQDLDNSGICTMNERVSFCPSITLTASNFDAEFEAFVFLGSILGPSPPAGCNPASHGFVDHS